MYSCFPCDVRFQTPSRHWIWGFIWGFWGGLGRFKAVKTLSLHSGSLRRTWFESNRAYQFKPM
jgi:hypothetical protein